MWLFSNQKMYVPQAHWNDRGCIDFYHASGLIGELSSDEKGVLTWSMTVRLNNVSKEEKWRTTLKSG